MGRKPAGIRSSAAPTLIDVARVAGVSPITVSRALGRPEVVTDATRKRVLEAVRATGYVPNLAAGSLASSRSRLVAIFLPTIANSIFADTVQALTDRLAAAGYQTLLGLTGYRPEQEEALLEAVLGRRPDGIVLTGTEHTQASRERLARVGIPLVEAWDLCEHPVDMLVGFSHEAVGQAVARYLLGKGYRRVSAVGIDDPRGLRRYRSLVAALQEHVAAPVAAQILPAPATLAVGREGLARLLQEGAAGEVVVCSSDTVAQGVMAEALSRGLRIPEDLAVMGFGDLSSAAHTHPPLSTVRVDGPRIGCAIAEALLARIAEPAAARQPLRMDVGFELIERGSA
ncbi:LacI family DNA-binding transcriptional regulator [Ectopseudomonas mendocina]|jgi:LacI family gluconate utilization system Gnt-I transcriptional repressor|uniref:GntR family transcriptional regulator n=1 Tax=Ectopseudomonas mendocina S5.2 TaxID=1225174 RepID=A0ABM5VU77_ECTME|nr:LacI family DNA-binding transcriptional regulator [Pseudomonas mendocina]MBL0950068.1 LacI family DNA-binding transcriptional regulator [Pseudomonas sp.]AEB59656.1 transcriptional regulator, LacI family [Pseudomonas mendocina NK-01]ALN18332.1 GntR family transcriptional regulator [Pseudomonas mendocina S5.2]KES00827.1 GntR family transcriptional regulator [Pseudomonas mendocina]QTN46612.1 LacI family DNA-binding transcriptional regulator [Pseudomonas mendocina]